MSTSAQYSIESAFCQVLEGNNKTLEEKVCHDRPLSSGLATQVYRQNAFGALLSALSSAYPVCKSILGTDYFSQCAKQYVLEYPLANSDLNLYGEMFPVYMVKLVNSKEELKDLTYLQDLCAVERALHESYYAAPRNTFALEAFSRLEESEVQRCILHLADDIKLYKARYDVQSILSFYQHSSEENLHLEAGSFYFLISRRQLKPELEMIDKRQYECLEHIQSTLCFTEVCEHFAESGEEENSAEPPPLGEYIARGWVDGFSLKSGEVQN